VRSRLFRAPLLFCRVGCAYSCTTLAQQRNLLYMQFNYNNFVFPTDWTSVGTHGFYFHVLITTLTCDSVTRTFHMSLEIVCLMDCLGKECQRASVCVCQECRSNAKNKYSYSMILLWRLPWDYFFVSILYTRNLGVTLYSELLLWNSSHDDGNYCMSILENCGLPKPQNPEFWRFCFHRWNYDKCCI
jgi:hypothetical protein